MNIGILGSFDCLLLKWLKLGEPTHLNLDSLSSYLLMLSSTTLLLLMNAIVLASCRGFLGCILVKGTPVFARPKDDPLELTWFTEFWIRFVNRWGQVYTESVGVSSKWIVEICSRHSPKWLQSLCLLWFGATERELVQGIESFCMRISGYL